MAGWRAHASAASAPASAVEEEIHGPRQRPPLQQQQQAERTLELSTSTCRPQPAERHPAPHQEEVKKGACLRGLCPAAQAEEALGQEAPEEEAFHRQEGRARSEGEGSPRTRLA